MAVESVEWKKRRVTIVGAGVSGCGLAMMASRLGASVFVTEKKAVKAATRELFDNAKISWEDGGHTSRAVDTDMLVLSSGIPPKSEIFGLIADAKKSGAKLEVLGELDFVVPLIAAQDSKIIGVTGSNGKSTVTALLGHILKKAGRDAVIGGNFGTAAAEFTSRHFDDVVLELSSFQLARTEHLEASKPFDIAIITNLAPDHIDWHGSYEAYKEAKARVLALRSVNGWGIVRDEDVDDLVKALDTNMPLERVITLSWDETPVHALAGHIFLNEIDRSAFLTLNGMTHKLFNFSDIKLLGRHNLENVAMSLTAVHTLGVEFNERDVAKLLEGFEPLPHRCANAGVINGVLYVDDSKGTNVAASATAMRCVQGRKIVILGGQGKGEDYAPLAEVVCNEAEAAVLIGAETEPIAAALERAGFSNFYRAKTMDEAVRKARDLAEAASRSQFIHSMTVLLSPACTSWDMYPNYKERGVDFCRVVHEIERENKR